MTSVGSVDGGWGERVSVACGSSVGLGLTVIKNEGKQSYVSKVAGRVGGRVGVYTVFHTRWVTHYVGHMGLHKQAKLNFTCLSQAPGTLIGGSPSKALFFEFWSHVSNLGFVSEIQKLEQITENSKFRIVEGGKNFYKCVVKECFPDLKAQNQNNDSRLP